MSYTELIPPEAVLLDLKASSQAEVLEALAERLGQLDPVLAGRREELVRALEERERQGSTASRRVAIPHIKLEGVEKVSVVMAIHREGVDFHALDGDPVHVFFSVVRPLEKADQHLGLLRWIAEIAQHQDFVSFALQARDERQVVDLLSELSPA